MTLKAYVQRAFQDGLNIEVRHKYKGKSETRWCNDVHQLRDCYHDWRHTGNTYMSLHHVPEPSSGPIRDRDVDRYTRLYFDIDANRPAHTSATQSELRSAIARADYVQKHMIGHGWPVPARAISGNGAHLYWRVAWPATDEVRELLRIVYDALARIMSDLFCTFNRGLGNPGRLSTFYGTQKRKGQHTARRPHRQTTVETPRHWYQVPLYRLEKLAHLYEHKPQKNIRTQEIVDAREHGILGDLTSLDSLAWFDSHGHMIGRTSAGVYAVQCPWHKEHQHHPIDADEVRSVLSTQDGSIDKFYCLDETCKGRVMLDVIDLWRDADMFCTRPL